VAQLKAEKDPLVSFRKRVTSAALLTDADLDTVDSEIEALIENSVALARKSPMPDPKVDLLTDVYIRY